MCSHNLLVGQLVQTGYLSGQWFSNYRSNELLTDSIEPRCESRHNKTGIKMKTIFFNQPHFIIIKFVVNKYLQRRRCFPPVPRRAH